MLSVTVKLVVQVALLPAALLAVTVIVCVPNPTTVPATGDWLKAICPAFAQPLTETLFKMLGTTAWQLPSALTPGSVGQFTVNAVELLVVTVTVVEQLARHPMGSETDMVSSWEPTSKTAVKSMLLAVGGPPAATALV